MNACTRSPSDSVTKFERRVTKELIAEGKLAPGTPAPCDKVTKCQDGHIFDLDNDATCDICGTPKSHVVDITQYEKAWDERLGKEVERKWQPSPTDQYIFENLTKTKLLGDEVIDDEEEGRVKSLSDSVDKNPDTCSQVKGTTIPQKPEKGNDSVFPDGEVKIASELMMENARNHGTPLQNPHIEGYLYEGVIYLDDIDLKEIEMSINDGMGAEAPDTVDFHLSGQSEDEDRNYTPEEKEAIWREELVEAELTGNQRGERDRITGRDADGVAMNQFKVLDLTGEAVRKYVYADGEIIIDDPQRLFIAESGSHRVEGEDGWLTYIVPGWRCIQWYPKDSEKPLAY